MVAFRIGRFGQVLVTLRIAAMVFIAMVFITALLVGASTYGWMKDWKASFKVRRKKFT
ncbi:MAG: hypothetical protein WBA43_14660 [Elainellaceae cyanobacterium]